VAIAQTEGRDLDSIILENGQSPFSVLPPDVVAVRRKLVSEQGQGVFSPPPPPTSFGIPENHPSADWVKRHLTPHPVSTFDIPSKSPTQKLGSAVLSSFATPTGRRSPASISRTSRAVARRLISSPATRHGASPRTSPSCRYCCGKPPSGGPAGLSKPAQITCQAGPDCDAKWAREVAERKFGAREHGQPNVASGAPDTKLPPR
jgi:hypothetical protein